MMTRATGPSSQPRARHAGATTCGQMVDLGTLKPFQFQMPQQWMGASSDSYIWFVNWCTKTKMHPPESTVCGRPSYVTQFSEGQCRANFDEAFEMHLVMRNSSQRERVVSGVVLRSKVTLENPDRIKWMEVAVRCDPSMPLNTVALEHNFTAVPLSVVRTPHDRAYTIKLRSRCACAGGCGKAMPVLSSEVASTAPPTTEDPATVAFRQWKLRVGASDTVYHRCGRITDEEKCAERTYCDFNRDRSRCAVARGQWLLMKTHSAQKYCNCTHVGGSGDKPYSIEECAALALKAQANVINYYNLRMQAEDKATPSQHGKFGAQQKPTQQSLKHGFVGGCYYKRCREADILGGRIPMAVAASGEGFDIYSINPFYSAATAASSTTAPPLP